MKEKELRESIRKQIIKKLNEAPDRFSKQVGGAVRSRLGRARQPLDLALKKIDVSKLARLPRQQKVGLLISLLQSVGITASDFDAIRARVSRGLADTIAPADESVAESVNEAPLPDLDKASGAYGGGREELKNKALASKKEKLQKTQAFKMLSTQLANKSPKVQYDFVVSLLNDLPLDDTAKRMMKMKLRQDIV
jgi:hypothetical protein